ncbi:hypothetical protein [Paenibacillus sp. B-A-8]|uniref:hypothetical protein n=1 Tax=Paenibacillus sp. B-A-8 TaxID=3400419 RepID=UPI003B01EBA5
MAISKRLSSAPATRVHGSFGCNGAGRDRYADDKNVFAGGPFKGTLLSLLIYFLRTHAAKRRTDKA